MKKLILTSRQKAIIKIIIQCSVTGPVTIGTISEKLKLSSRTVLRQLPDIENWFLQNGISIIRKPGVGIVLAETLENQNRLLELLECETVDLDYSKEERLNLLQGELLLSKEPIKSYYLTSKFKISDGTLSSDLDIIEKRLADYRITLCRRQGLGIYLEGREKDYRHAIAGVLFDTLEENELIDILNGKISNNSSKIEISVRNRVLGFIDKKTMDGVERILLEMEKKIGVKYTDSAYIGLIVHICLAMKRILENENIVMDGSALLELRALPEFSIAAEIVGKLAETFGLVIPDEEIGYITMHLKGAKLRLNKGVAENNLSDMNFLKLSRKIVLAVEKELAMTLRENGSLVEDIAKHLGPALSRLSMGMIIKNPQLTEIQTKYKRIYEATEKACRILTEFDGIESIPEAEVGYIAMHVGAAMLNNSQLNGEISAVIVCPTGLGTSKLLAVSLEKEFPQIAVKSIISAIKIKEEELEQDGIDIIISTVPLHVNYKNICVSPILRTEDKVLLQSTIQGLMLSERKKAAKKPQGYVEIIESATRLGEEILYLLKHIKIYAMNSISHKEELIEAAATLLGEDADSALKIMEDLRKREEIASTYIEDFKMLLLHCATSGIKRQKLGILRLQHSLVTGNGEEIRGGIILLVPSENNQTAVEIMSEISAALIEREGFVSLLLTASHGEITEELTDCLGRFYKRNVKKKLNGLERTKND